MGGAIAFSAAAVLALAAAVALERRWRALIIPVLYLLNLVYESIAPLLGGRELLLTQGVDEPGSAAKWLTRLVILITLTLCSARLLGAGFAGENRRAGGEVLFSAFAVYFLTSVVLSGAFGEHPEFKHDQYYVPFLFAAVYASRTQQPETAVRFAKGGFFSTNYQYLVSYKGFAFFTKVSEPFLLPAEIEIIMAEKIWIPT